MTTPNDNTSYLENLLNEKNVKIKTTMKNYHNTV